MTEDTGRFKEIPVLLSISWFEIRGKINISMLSPLMLYKAYLVYEVHDAYGFKLYTVQLSVGFVGGQCSKTAAYLDPERGRDDDRLPNARIDEWLEVEFFNEGCLDDVDLEMRALEDEGPIWKRGLIIQGIEVRTITPILFRTRTHKHKINLRSRSWF
ncbi:putative F-box protein PP2-B8 [Hibiscus syriacus]|uniref:putative F-box protein PP2-B8 n=1 Tax=Hibiscus syriacus TaxID=106335 RepID=UPI001922FE25|nr:putative F-box protein PP2-B8 [Hibiscus syriacus]